MVDELLTVKHPNLVVPWNFVYSFDYRLSFTLFKLSDLFSASSIFFLRYLSYNIKFVIDLLKPMSSINVLYEKSCKNDSHTESIHNKFFQLGDNKKKKGFRDISSFKEIL